MSLRLDLKSNRFQAKPIYLAFNVIFFFAKNLTTLTICISHQIVSRWFDTSNTYIGSLAIFLQDLVSLLGFPVFIVMLLASRRHQVDFLNMSIEFDRHMDQHFGCKALVSQTLFTQTWLKCLAWIVYYNLFLIPFELCVFGLTVELKNISFLCCYTVVVSEIGLALSYIEFCAALHFRQTERLRKVLVNIFANLHQPNASQDAVKAMDMIRHIEELRYHFGASFSKALHFICQIVTCNSVFVVYLIMQIVWSIHFTTLSIDNVMFFLPLVVRILWLAGRMEEFGTKVSF